MNSSRRLVTLLVALMISTAAAFGVWFFTDSSANEAPVILTPTAIPTVPVLVARVDIPANVAVTADMVELRQIRAEDRHPRALTVAEEAVGRVTTVALLAGEQMLDTRLALGPTDGGSGDTFAYTVPVGMRAFSLVFDEVIGAGALIQPGDHVDVIAYFELDVTKVDGRTDDGPTVPADQQPVDGEPTQTPSPTDYTQFVSAYIVQDVEVLAVAQATTPEESGVQKPGAQPSPTPALTGTATVNTTTADTGNPVARPGAASVTLAVTPDQAQRLMLAAMTVKESKGGLRLSLRSPGDTTTVALDPAQLGQIPLNGILGNVNQPMVPSDLAITSAQFTKRVLTSGEVLEFRVTVKNISETETVTSGRDAPPEYTYTQGEGYDTLGYFEKPGSYRIGLNFAGSSPTAYPYRWSLGRDLGPGESVEIVGSVKLTDPTSATRYWFGVILEPNTVTQDGVGVADITVLQPSSVNVNQDSAQLRATPDKRAPVTVELARGTALTVLDVQGDWFHVRTADDTEGWIASDAVQIQPAS